MDDLLKPVLSDGNYNRSLYSSRALFLTGFFGGSFAVIFLSALNSQKLKRLKIDIVFYLIAPVLLFLFLYYVIAVPEGAQGYGWLKEYRRTTPIYKYGPRALALVFWAISYALHQKYHKAMGVMGITPLNPWIPAILCSVVGAVMQFGLIYFVLKLHGVS